MKIHYWGTAAAEGIPGVFCGCDACVEARRKKGKYIRTRSQIMINDDLLVDFGADTYAHSLAYGYDMSRLGHVLVTHTHFDHYHPAELFNRLAGFAHNIESETLAVHGPIDIVESLLARTEREKSFREQNRVVLDILRPFETVRIMDYEVTPLPARHGTKNPFVYLIVQGEKSFLLLNDTGRPLPEVYDWLKEKKIKLSAISFDCTYGNCNTILRFGDVGHHMGLIDNFAVKQMLAMQGNVTDETVCIVTHFSHNAIDVGYDQMRPYTDKYGFVLAYDGLVVEI